MKQPGGLHAAWLALYDVLDKAAPRTNKCADTLREADPTAPPSFTLRNILGNLGPDIGKRVAIPALFYRVRRCNAGDAALLASVVAGEAGSPVDLEQSTPSGPTSYDQVGQDSAFLSGIIKASEMWSVPSPSWEDELKEYKKGLLPSDMFTDFAWYCYLTGAFNDPACTGLKAKYPKIDFSKVNTPKFAYKPDQYWHKFAAIPAQTSVLIMNGKLDFQTVSDGGVREYKNLKGDAAQKMMVEFEYGGHGVGITPSTYSDRTACGYRIIASFVAVGGKTDKVDTKCLSDLPPLKFNDLSALQTLLPDLNKAEDFYDADLTALLSGSDGDSDDEDVKKLSRYQNLHLRFEKALAMAEADRKEAEEQDEEEGRHHKHHHHAKVHRAKKKAKASTDKNDTVPGSEDNPDSLDESRHKHHKHHHRSLE